jgi:peptide/nickel transport system substrate-binding protein
VLPRWNPLVGWPANEELVVFNEAGDIAPNVATGWKWSDDHLALTVSLQKGVKFHDGTDFNAQAVKFNWDLLLAMPARIVFENVKSVEIIDDYTIKLNFKQYDNLGIVDLATEGGCIVSPTAIKAYGQDYLILNPVGIGPFKCVSSVRDVSIKYEKFTDYWRKGQPYLNGIEFVFMADPVTAKLSFLAKEGQMVGNISAVDAADLQKKGNFNISVAPNQVISLGPDGGNPKSPFADIRVRQALSYALDTKAIVSAIGYGFLEPANQAAYKGVWSYNPNVIGYPYNPAKAKELLAAAGYPNGLKTKITYSTGFSDVASVVTVAQRFLADVGIQADLVPLSQVGFDTARINGWEGIICTQITCSIGYDPLKTFKLNMSSVWGGYKSLYRAPEVEAKFNQALAEPDQAKKVTFYQQAIKMMVDDYCEYAPIYIRPAMAAKYPQLHGDKMYEPQAANWRPMDAWLSK